MSTALIDQLVERHGFALLTSEMLDGFLDEHPQSVLFFTENPQHFPESSDVAVILPELMSVFGDRLSGAVIARESERELHKRYGFKGWPTLVFLRGHEYLGAITRVQDWSDYLHDINEILNGDPIRPPSIGIPVVEASTSGCHG